MTTKPPENHTIARISPEGGVPKFIRSFGGQTRVLEACRAMGFSIGMSEIKDWRRCNSIPEHLYSPLEQLVLKIEEVTAKDHTIEVLYKGKTACKLFLHPDFKLVIRGSKK